MPFAQRSLDFIVIGAQKGGTTTLWRHLGRHPSIWMPPLKEEPFFCNPGAGDPGALAEYMRSRFAEAGEDMLLGKASPQYMSGSEHADVEKIAGRIAAALPEVRLIALLRDPVERALSHYRMSVRRGLESRGADAALQAQLDPAALEAGRGQPTETNSYVAQGEYGRILSAYRPHIPGERIHVELTDDLDREPGAVLDRVLSFLSLPTGFRPSRLDARYHRGGTKPLLDRESRASLLEFMDDNVWPRVGEEGERLRRLFGAFLQVWDIAPAAGPAISGETRARLELHYQADASRLDGLGLSVPWSAS